MRRWHYLLLVIVALVLLAAAAAALFGPDLLRERARAWVSTETGRTLEIGKVSVNLLALSVEVRDVTLTEADRTTPFVAWERLYVALSPRSLWHRAPVIRRLQLDKPTARIERRPDGRFNFSDLLERGQHGEPPPKNGDDGAPARFSLNNLEIAGGRIEFLDRTPAKATTHRIESLELAIPFIGNLPYLEDRYVQPLLRATVNGTPFEIKGEVKPFADTQEYSLKLKFAGIDLPYYLGYLPDTLPVKVHHGRLDVDLDLTYRASAASKPVLELAGRCDLTTLDLRERNGQPLLFLPLLETRLAASYPLERKIHLAAVTIHRPQSWIERNPAGEWNVARLGGGGSKAAATEDGLTTPLQLRIDRLELENGRLELRDDLPAGGFTTTLSNIGLDIDDFTLAQGTPFKLLLTMASARREQLTVSGQVTLDPLALDLTVDARQLPLAAYQPYYQAQATASISGVLDVNARLQRSSAQPLLISEAGLVLHNLELPLPDGEGFRLTQGALLGGSYDLAANRFAAASLTFNGAQAKFSRDRSGRWSFFDRSYPLLTARTEPATAAEPATAPESRPFSWRIGEIVLHDGRLAMRDALPAEPARFEIAGLAATVRDLAAPDIVTASFDVQGSFQQHGRFRLSGTAVPGGPEVTADLQLQRIPLTAFAPYLGEQVRLVLVDGALDTRLTVAAARRSNRWQGRFGGGFGVTRFYCLDADHREDLLRWESLQVSGIDGRIEPFALKVAAIALSDYYARVLLDEQSQLNFTQLLVKKADGKNGATTKTAAATPAPGRTTAPRPEIRIGKVTLHNGRVNFTDRHLPQPFSAEMLQLGGRVEGLSSTPGTLAEVDLRGRLRNESPLTISGTLNPLADPLFLNLKLDFNDIELSPLSPYSGTYVGYLIERGKLNVALAYHVENGRLDASNKLFLDQFTFGGQVASDRATSLPVRLAVALLKDRNGEIHLDIPVSGDVSDPRFSVWGVVWQIIKNLLLKAVTSPLALLGGLAGGEDFSAIVFPSGSSALTEAEQTKLGKIAAALRDRADLKIEVKGYVDPDNDPEGYRRELLQTRLQREKLIDLRKRQGEGAPADAGAVAIAPQEYPEYLWRVYKAADFPKPRNLIGMVKHLPDAELEKLLLANTRIGSEELTALAQARARTVVTALTETGGIPRERVFLATTEIAALPAVEGSSRSRVEFGMALK